MGEIIFPLAYSIATKGILPTKISKSQGNALF
jgi:hypothetical protein